MAETGPDYESLKQQIQQHKQLQQDLEQQQRVVDALSNMVVVVDENSPESGKLEMDAQQRHILVLQESVQQFQTGPDSANNNDMLEKIETLQDRWDALIQIMEVQGQRITASGFEFNMTPAPGEIVTTVTSGSQWEVKETITTVTSQEVSCIVD
ncbi:hypothetical protein C0J52_24409 [Blattella germanica]|nr:hypothetical protein C0J52_24409 [Blattella germanica]